MRAYLITGNPGSAKSDLAAELSRRGLAAADADDLAFWEGSAGRGRGPAQRGWRTGGPAARTGR